jgi:hypothetical protein
MNSWLNGSKGPARKPNDANSARTGANDSTLNKRKSSKMIGSLVSSTKSSLGTMQSLNSSSSFVVRTHGKVNHHPNAKSIRLGSVGVTNGLINKSMLGSMATTQQHQNMKRKKNGDIGIQSGRGKDGELKSTKNKLSQLYRKSTTVATSTTSISIKSTSNSQSLVPQYHRSQLRNKSDGSLIPLPRNCNDGQENVYSNHNHSGFSRDGNRTEQGQGADGIIYELKSDDSACADDNDDFFDDLKLKCPRLGDGEETNTHDVIEIRGKNDDDKCNDNMDSMVMMEGETPSTLVLTSLASNSVVYQPLPDTLRSDTQSSQQSNDGNQQFLVNESSNHRESFEDEDGEGDDFDRLLTVERDVNVLMPTLAEVLTEEEQQKLTQGMISSSKLNVSDIITGKATKEGSDLESIENIQKAKQNIMEQYVSPLAQHSQQVPVHLRFRKNPAQLCHDINTNAMSNYYISSSQSQYTTNTTPTSHAWINNFNEMSLDLKRVAYCDGIEVAESSISTIKFDNHGDLFAVAGHNGIVRIYDLKACLEQEQILHNGHAEAFNEYALKMRYEKVSNASSKIVKPMINHWDRNILKENDFDIKEQKLKPVEAFITRKSKRITDIAWSPLANEDVIAVCFEFDTDVWLYDLTNILPSRDANMILSGSRSRKGNSILHFENIISSNGTSNSSTLNYCYLYVGSMKCNVSKWKVPSFAVDEERLKAPKKALWEIEIDPQQSKNNLDPVVAVQVLEQEILLTCTKNGIISLWDLHNTSSKSFQSERSPTRLNQSSILTLDGAVNSPKITGIKVSGIEIISNHFLSKHHNIITDNNGSNGNDNSNDNNNDNDQEKDDISGTDGQWFCRMLITRKDGSIEWMEVNYIGLKYRQVLFNLRKQHAMLGNGTSTKRGSEITRLEKMLPHWIRKKMCTASSLLQAATNNDNTKITCSSNEMWKKLDRELYAICKPRGYNDFHAKPKFQAPSGQSQSNLVSERNGVVIDTTEENENLTVAQNNKFEVPSCTPLCINGNVFAFTSFPHYDRAYYDKMNKKYRHYVQMVDMTLGDNRAASEVGGNLIHGARLELWQTSARDHDRKLQQSAHGGLSYTLPGHVVEANPGSDIVKVSFDPRNFLISKQLAASVTSKSSSLLFDFSSVVSYSGGDKGCDDAECDKAAKPSVTAFLYKDVSKTNERKATARTASLHSVRSVDLFTIQLWEPYAGPVVQNAYPKVRLRTSLETISRSSKLCAFDYRGVAQRKRDLFIQKNIQCLQDIVLGEPATALATNHTRNTANTATPYLVIGRRDDSVKLYSPSSLIANVANVKNNC